MSFLSTYKIPQPRGYSEGNYYIEDTSATSPNYFDLVSFPDVVGGGKYVFKIKGNGINMRINSTIDVEIIDAEGQRIFCEVVDFSDRFNNYYITVEIYDITAQGLATAYFVREAAFDLNGQPVPAEYKDEYNVRWTKSFMVMPYERNITDLIFDEPPQVGTAQVITPAKLQTQATGSAYVYKSITGSVNLMNIVTSDFYGYDRDFATSPDILDQRLRSIQVNPLTRPTTINSVPTAIREKDSDIQNGTLINYTTRFNTRLITSSPFFKKEHLGGYFEFFDSASSPQIYNPPLPASASPVTSVATQFDSYNSTIVEVVSDTQAILSKPLTINITDSNFNSANTLSTHMVKAARKFTGSITYAPSDLTFVSSTTVSQSYVEFTFSDLKPISGEVYRIKTSIKLGSITGDYKLLNDQIITPLEYLIDNAYSNVTSYGKHESEYRLIGHFTTQSFLDNYWVFYQQTGLSFPVVTGSINNNVQIESAALNAAYTQSSVFTTKYYQNYNSRQVYTLSFYLTLDPYTELEVYMGSDPVNSNIITSLSYPRAFLKTNNQERALLPGEQTPYGKYIGRVSNDRSNRKYYGRVLFDFETDASGFGAPRLRSNIIDYANKTGSAYVSEVSIKPYKLNGFTPNLVQYAVPLPTEFVQAVSVSQSIDFKIDYFDFTGRQSEYTTYIDDVVLNLKADVQSNTCQTDKLTFSYNSNTYFFEG
jgi:hypothetical protein